MVNIILNGRSAGQVSFAIATATILWPVVDLSHSRAVAEQMRHMKCRRLGDRDAVGSAGRVSQLKAIYVM